MYTAAFMVFVSFLIETEEPNKEKEMLEKFRDFQQKAEMYYVYHAIQRYTVCEYVGKRY